jgi:hypothetical protein
LILEKGELKKTRIVNREMKSKNGMGQIEMTKKPSMIYFKREKKSL